MEQKEFLQILFSDATVSLFHVNFPKKSAVIGDYNSYNYQLHPSILMHSTMPVVDFVPNICSLKLIYFLPLKRDREQNIRI